MPFDFVVSTAAVSRPDIVEAVPRSGHLAGGAQHTVRLRVRAGVPVQLLETVHVEVR